MPKGYQLIDLQQLYSLCYPGRFEILFIILSYLAERIQKEIDEKRTEIEIEVICEKWPLSRTGHPSLGIYYLREPAATTDFGPIVEEAVGRLLKELTLLEILNFVENREPRPQVYWSKELAKVMHAGQGPEAEGS